jgi:hypothetical protein
MMRQRVASLLRLLRPRTLPISSVE